MLIMLLQNLKAVHCLLPSPLGSPCILTATLHAVTHLIHLNAKAIGARLQSKVQEWSAGRGIDTADSQWHALQLVASDKLL